MPLTHGLILSPSGMISFTGNKLPGMTLFIMSSAVLPKADTSHTGNIMRNKLYGTSNKEDSSPLFLVVVIALGGLDNVRMLRKIHFSSTDACPLMADQSSPHFSFLLSFSFLPASLMSEATLFQTCAKLEDSF